MPIFGYFLVHVVFVGTSGIDTDITDFHASLDLHAWHDAHDRSQNTNTVFRLDRQIAVHRATMLGWRLDFHIYSETKDIRGENSKTICEFHSFHFFSLDNLHETLFIRFGRD